MADMVRVNTRISIMLNDWLDKRSKKTGLPKSTIIMLALENYYQQTDGLEKMTDLASLYRYLDEIKSKLG